MINEDLDPCAPPPRVYTRVNFEYTYNMSGSLTGYYVDWFNDHAGSAYLYVFDDDGTYLFRDERNKVNMDPNKINFEMIFDDTQFVPGNKYLLVGMAQGNHAGYEASLETPGFTLQQEMIPGLSKIQDYRIKLDRDDDGVYDLGVINYKDTYGDNRQMIDTLWSTKPNSVQSVDIPYISYKPQRDTLPSVWLDVTIPMMRITNSIKINLVHDSFNENTDVNAYDIIIDFPNGNGTIGFTGATDKAKRLIYQSLRKQTKIYQSKSNGAQYDASVEGASLSNDPMQVVGYEPSTRAAQYCINAEFGVSRLQVADGSSLKIYSDDKENPIVTIDNFAAWLADYFDHNYDDQEFLDREYDFTVDIHMDTSGRVTWIQAGVAILGWGKRKQLVNW